jgi:hypothetical protein
MKTFLLKLTLLVLSPVIIFSCNQKYHNSPNPTPTGAQVTIGGQTYTAQSQITIPYADYYYYVGGSPKIPAGGGYLSYTDTATTDVKIYEYTFLQANIPVTGDTVAVSCLLYSTSPIATGTYPVYSAAKTITTYPAAIFEYGDTRNTYDDSTGSGTLVITKIDMTNNVISGTYNYAGIGTKGSNPATIAVTNGQLNNIGVQKFY